LLLDLLAQGLDQVEAIGDLPGLRCPQPGTLGIQPVAITADDLDLRVVTQSGSDACGGAVGQHVHYPSPLQVDHDGPVALALPLGPVVIADHPEQRRTRPLLHGPALHDTQDGIVAHGHPEALQDPLRRAPTGAVAKEVDDVCHPARPPGIAVGDPGEALGEDALGTGVMTASQARDAPFDRHPHALQRQVLE
jgi:hypothetical protein